MEGELRCGDGWEQVGCREPRSSEKETGGVSFKERERGSKEDKKDTFLKMQKASRTKSKRGEGQKLGRGSGLVIEVQAMVRRKKGKSLKKEKNSIRKIKETKGQNFHQIHPGKKQRKVKKIETVAVVKPLWVGKLVENKIARNNL